MRTYYLQAVRAYVDVSLERAPTLKDDVLFQLFDENKKASRGGTQGRSAEEWVGWLRLDGIAV